MKVTDFLWTIAPASVAVAAVLVAGQPQTALGQDAPATRGSRIAALGNGRGAPACASCHAYNGVADPSGAFPRLAGLSQTYLLRSLDGFASGQRNNAIMTGIARALSAPERADVAAYYASVSAPVPPAPPVDEKTVAMGRVIATVGLNDQQVPACAACHGPLGHSVTGAIPSLAGQYSRYIVFELRAFRAGQRSAGAASMAAIAHALSDAQELAVASYFQRAGEPPVPPGADVATVQEGRAP
jgi:cytochrome c553